MDLDMSNLKPAYVLKTGSVALTVERIDSSANDLDVRLRHRLLPQPGGFEGFLIPGIPDEGVMMSNHRADEGRSVCMARRSNSRARASSSDPASQRTEKPSISVTSMSAASSASISLRIDPSAVPRSMAPVRVSRQDRVTCRTPARRSGSNTALAQTSPQTTE